MERQIGMGIYEDQVSQEIMYGEDGSGESDEFDTVSNEEHAESSKKGKEVVSSTGKKYKRHTPQQIQALENFFKECAHPDENQRLELGRRLGLEGKQVKFWFQNRRTQLKSQMERRENEMLKQEYDKLRAEHITLKGAMMNPMCQGCGRLIQVVPAELSAIIDHQLKLENAQLRNELTKLYTEKLHGNPASNMASQISVPNSGIDLLMGMRRSSEAPNDLIGMQVPVPTIGCNHDLNGIISGNSSLANTLDGGPITNEPNKAVL